VHRIGEDLVHGGRAQRAVERGRSRARTGDARDRRGPRRHIPLDVAQARRGGHLHRVLVRGALRHRHGREDSGSAVAPEEGSAAELGGACERCDVDGERGAARR
ncbi:MAG: hypothetical protein ACK55I_30255, partial [bacterium]